MAQKRVDFVIKEKGASKAAGGFKKVDGAMASAAKSAAMYAAAYIGVRGIINITKTAIEAFGVQEQAEKRLTVATGRNTDALLKQASALQQVTTFGDEMIIGVQASLAAFAESDDEIKRLTVATLDLASATGMDLKAAGDLIAKSYGSSTNALSRYGIEVTGVANSTERLDTLTGNIAARFEGQAAAAAETMAGKISQMKNAVGDAAEALGGAMSPAVIAIANSIKSLSELLTPANEALDRLALLSKNSVPLTKEQAAANKAWLATMREINAELEIQTELRSTMRVIQTDENFRIADTVTLLKSQADVVNDLRTEYEKLGAASLESGLKGLAMSQDLGDASRALAQQYIVEGVFGAVKGALTEVPFPYNLLAAGAAGIAANAIFTSVMPAATGADFVTDGPQLMMVGEAGREQVSVTPLEGPNLNGPQGGVTVNFNGPITDREYVRGYIIPEIKEAVRLNA